MEGTGNWAFLPEGREGESSEWPGELRQATPKEEVSEAISLADDFPFRSHHFTDHQHYLLLVCDVLSNLPRT